MTFTQGDHRALGFAVLKTVGEQRKVSDLIGWAREDETIDEFARRIGGIVADALDRKLAPHPA